MKDKFPLKIVIGDYGPNRFGAATSLSKLSEKSANVRQELEFVERDYSVLIRSSRDTIEMSSEKKRVDPRLLWLVGDNIIRFLERIDDLGFYLIQQNKTLARDIETSESSIKKIVSFRMRFPTLSTVDPAIPWARYRDNKVPVQKERRR